MSTIENILIFEPDLKGHRLEYVHHLYCEAVNSNLNYYFVLSADFEKVKNKFEWQNADNIKVILLDKLEEDSFKANGFYTKYKVLNKYIHICKASRVFFIMLMQYLPIIPLFFFSKIKFEGIIYRIYLYEWTNSRLKKKLTEVLKWLFVSKCSSISRGYILNDSSSAIYLNKVYSTDKFRYLADPFTEITYIAKDKREELGIAEDKKIFLHFGGLTKRKGTMDIMNSLFKLTEEEKQRYTFIFAGVVYKDIKEEFYEKYNKLKDTVDIRIFDEFCSYEFLNDLCYTSDCILIPYHNTNQSSGIISYAANYNKPVIGPKGGLLGKLIRKYHLGITIDIKDGIHKYLDTKFPIGSNRYIQEHSTSVFSKAIITEFQKQ